MGYREGPDSSEEDNQGNREIFDEVSDYGPIAPAPIPNVETQDEFERLVNQVAG